MATTKESPLAVTLKQKRPFVTLQQEAYLNILCTASELSHLTRELLRMIQPEVESAPRSNPSS